MSFSFFTTRAVHLEWLVGMSTEEFLHCFRRFVARRGYPVLVYCDNAPQFKLARDTLQYAFMKAVGDSDVLDFSDQLNIPVACNSPLNTLLGRAVYTSVWYH